MKAYAEKRDIEAAAMLKAIAHPSRIQILRLLSDKPGKKMSVSDIQEALGLTQPETSRHLLTMKLNGVLTYEKEGLNVFYAINNENTMAGIVTQLLKKL